MRGGCLRPDGPRLALFPNLARVVAQTRLALRALLLRQTKVDEHAVLSGRVVQEVGGLDIPVEDIVLVRALEGREEGPQVDPDVRDGHVAKVRAEVGVAEIREDGDDLVGVAEGRDEGADGGAAAQVVEELQLVEDARGRRCDVDLLYGDVASAFSRGVMGGVALEGRSGPFRGFGL